MDIAESAMQYALTEQQSASSSQQNIGEDSHFLGQLVENELLAINSQECAVAKF